MAAISFVTLGAACKLCIGIYVASILVFTGALALFLNSGRAATPRLPPQMGGTSVRAHAEQPAGAPPPSPLPLPILGAAVIFGGAAVLVPVLVYAAAAPDYSGFAGTCGTLDQPNAPDTILITLGSQDADVRAIEVLDPLCPACRGFEERLASTGHDDRLARKVILFPLDSTCNWMVDEAIHPGACAVSEAMLCAGDRAEDVLEWAFDEQEDIREAAAADPNAAKRMIAEEFPDLGRCVGSANARARLNRSLQWAVANELPVLTPQLYVNDVRVCDADTDLGLDYTLGVLLEQAEAGTLRPEGSAPRAEGAGGGTR
jgi:protein-disulfide isomerase